MERNVVPTGASVEVCRVTVCLQFDPLPSDGIPDYRHIGCAGVVRHTRGVWRHTASLSVTPYLPEPLSWRAATLVEATDWGDGVRRGANHDCQCVTARLRRWYGDSEWSRLPPLCPFDAARVTAHPRLSGVEVCRQKTACVWGYAV